MKLDKLSFASLIGYLSRAARHEFSDNELIDIDNIIDINPPVTQYASVEMIQELLRQLNAADGFIPAIKAYMALTNAGLKEAKEIIERYRNVVPINAPFGTQSIRDILNQINEHI